MIHSSSSTDLDSDSKDYLRLDIQTNIAIIKKDQGDPDGGIGILEKALNSSTAKSIYFNLQCIDYFTLDNLDKQANLICNLAYCYDEKKNFKNSLQVRKYRIYIEFIYKMVAW